MQLNITTDYAIRLVYYLASVGRPAGRSEISDSMCVPRSAFGPIAQSLKRGGILDTHRGASGGYLLTKRPEDMSLGAIINIMEGTTRINRCLEEGNPCNRNGAPSCPVHKFYSHIQSYLDEVFEQKTIASLMKDA